jgi:glycine cleavage system H lipoate-binding protein
MSIMFIVLIIVIVIIITVFQSVDAVQNVTFDNGSKVNQDSAAYFSNTVNLSDNIGHSELPHVAVSGNNVYVVWLDDVSGNRDIHFRKSTNNGCTFGETVDISNQNGGSADPQLAVSGDNIYVVWEHSPENNGAIFFTRSTDNGTNFEKIRNLGNNTGFNGFPQIAVSGNNVYLVWRDATHGVFFTRSTDNGTNFEKIRNLGNNTGFNGFPQIAVSGNNVYIVWTKNAQEKYGQVFFTRSTDNGATFRNPIALGEAKHDDRHRLVFSPHISGDGRTNNVYVVWHSGRVVHQVEFNLDVLVSDVQFTRSTDNGATFDSTVNLGNKSGWSINPQIAVSQDNNVYVVWTNNAQEKYGQVFFTRSTDNGATFDSTVNLSNKSGWSINPQIAVSQDNNVYVVWTDNAQEKYGQVFFTRSTDNGATFYSTVNLSNKSGWSINPQIAVSQDNNVYVVWTNNVTGNEEIIIKSDTKINCTSPNHANNYAPKDVKPINIAFIDPTFTIAAYDKSFYLFYAMDNKTSAKSSKITEDIGLLSSIVPQNYEDKIESHEIRNHLKWLMPKSNIERLTDQDVDGDKIFTKGTNKYDIVVLSHQEYVTQREYDNLKQFVANGGILLLLDGNVFYAEVKYDKNTNSISLVKGHYWGFNGTLAQRSVEERWKNETSEWIGSNYLCCWEDKILLNNNPFGMEHDEEQHITNPRAKILLDYNATEDEPNPRKFIVATYELDYKKGKVITLGFYSDHLKKNDRFWRFFDSLLYQYPLGQQRTEGR